MDEMWSLLVLFLTILINPAFGVIDDLNDTEYSRMPPIAHLDDYTNCLKEANGVYCTVEFSAISDAPSELLTMMQEYSNQYKIHYNHTNFRYGICVTQRCRNYSGHNKEVLKEVLEGYLNETFWKEYNLKTQVTKYNCDGLDDEIIPIDTSDIVVGILIISLVILNVIGSLSDVFFSKSEWQGKEYFLSFSIMRNWRKLVITSSPDERFNRLRSVNGMKSIIIFSVLMAHSICPQLILPVNSHDLEKNYNGTFEYIILNGSLVIQICFFTTTFLLMYKIRRYSENNEINFRVFLKGLLIRLLRILPVYAVVLAIKATWYRHLGSGPLWQTEPMVAANDCRRNWWLHMLFLNNFVHNSKCLGSTWFIAADMQLYVMCLLICVLAKTDGTRRGVLRLLYVIGVIIPPAVVYFLDLEPRFILSPEGTSSFFIQDKTYNELYVRPYTNIAPSALGLIVGDLVYRWQLDKDIMKKIQAYKKIRLMYWLLFPLCLYLIISAKYFYKHPYLEPWYSRVLFTSTVPPLFTFSVAVLVVGYVFKFEDVYRSFTEWKGWAVSSRLTYGAFLVHFPLLRLYTGTLTSLKTASPVTTMVIFLGLATSSFLLATLLWLFVETPILQISKLCLQPTQKRKIS